MAKQIELSNEEMTFLRDILDMQEEQWKETLELLTKEPFDSWEELLKHTSFSSEAIDTLKKIRSQLDERGSTSEAV
jgi:transposase-like protein